MKKTKFLFFLLMPIFAIGQVVRADSLNREEGIQFESGLSWREVQAKAKSENKYIFMDCYATWCGPCKWMAAHIFTRKEVGDFFNSHFVCVALQTDKTKQDNENIKSWYSDAETIKQAYGVDEYPSFLFFSSDGKLVHRVIGAIRDEKQFIAKGSEALNPAEQYYTKMSHWQEHTNDTAYLWKAYAAAKEVDDEDRVSAIAEAYLNMQPDLFAKKDLALIANCNLLGSSNSKWFQFFRDNALRIDDSIDGVGKKREFVEWALRLTVYREEVLSLCDKGNSVYWSVIEANLSYKYSQLAKDFSTLIKGGLEHHVGLEIDSIANQSGKSHPDWPQIAIALRQKYPDFDFQQILLEREGTYYEHHNLWIDCGKVAYALMRQYGSGLGEYHMNNIAWYWVFAHCDEQKILKEALKRMKHVIKTNQSTEFLDTYANLLYKRGQKERALIFETRVVDEANKNHVDASDLKGFQTNLSNMKNGQPTWGNNITS